MQVQQDVLRLDVPVYNVLGVQVGHADANLHEVVLGIGLLESAEPPQMVKEFAPRAVVQHEGDVEFGLKGKVELRDELVVQARHDVALVLHNNFLLIIHDEFLVDELEGVEFSIVAFTDQVHAREAAYADAFH